MALALLVSASCAKAGLIRSFELPSTAPALFPKLSVQVAAADPGAKTAGDDTKMTLADAYRLALERSETVSVAREGITAAEIRDREQRNEMMPTAAINANAILRRTGQFGQGRQFLVEATVAQPLFRRGYFTARAAGERGEESARANVQRQREQLARDVAGALIDVLRTRRLVELAKTSTVRASAQLDHATSRVKAGSALRNVELQARLDFKRAEQQSVIAVRDASLAETSFIRVVGRPAPPQLELPQELVLPSREEAIDLAKRRADVQALQLRLDEAQKQEEAAGDRRWWPELDVAATAQYYVPEVGGTADLHNFEWNVVALLTIPVFLPAQHTAYDARGSEARLAALELSQQLKVVVEEVDLAAFQLSSAVESARLANEQVEAARELYKLVDRQFRLGAITFLEVTNAQSILVEAENSFEITRMDRVRSIYDYLFVIGALDVRSGTPVVGAGAAP